MVMLDSYQEAARKLREATKDKSYRAYPMGQEAGHYLRWKRGRLTENSYRCYEGVLDKLARTFPDLTIEDFEPPVGTQRLEEFMDERWGDGAPKTYNVNLSVLKDFFKFACLKGHLHGDPTLPMERHKVRQHHREVFSEDDRERILADGPSDEKLLRDRVALHLLLKYALRKDALRRIQFKHFDHHRRQITIFTKGGKVRRLPIVDAALWSDLGQYIIEWEAKPEEYLLCSRKVYGRKPEHQKEIRDKPLSAHGLHDWWYGCLQRAGIVAEGVTTGAHMHRARHTAGQRVLDKTGNLKAVQKLLGHASISTTADIYTDWDIEQLAETMRGIE